MNGKIYLDHNATSPPSHAHAQGVVQKLLNAGGNPSSPHAAGREAHVAVTEARKALAQALCCDVSEVVFVSGGSEANNLGTVGVLRALDQRVRTADRAEGHTTGSSRAGSECLESPMHVLSSAIEHPSVREPIKHALHTLGCEATILPVDADGRVTAAEIVASLTRRTRLVAMMAANNETGVLLPVKEFGDWLHDIRWAPDKPARAAHPLDAHLPAQVTRETLKALHFHVDAVQAFGKLRPESWVSPGYDSFSVCGHKVGGFSGSGALVLRRGRVFTPGVLGGAQERARRAGTENLPGILSLGLIATEIQTAGWWRQVDVMRSHQEALRSALEAFSGVRLNTPATGTLPNTVNFSLLPGMARGEDVLMALDLQGICASSGSACSSGANLASGVLIALGRSAHEARNAVRLSLGLDTSLSEIERVVSCLRDCLDAS